VNNPRAERQILLNGAAAQCSSSSSSLTGAMGVSVAPWSGAPGGSVTSALQVGHYSLALSPPTKTVTTYKFPPLHQPLVALVFMEHMSTR